MNNNSAICLASACLAGLCTRYDGVVKPCSFFLEKVSGQCWLPVCPEQLGGLPTPRTPADLVGGDGYDVLAGRASVITRTGLDVTERFIFGARQCLLIVQAQKIRVAFLRSKSPSCGLTPRVGVTAALLLQHGLEVREF